MEQVPGTAAAIAAPVRRYLGRDPGIRLAFSGRADGNLSLVVGAGDAAGREVLDARERLAGLVGLESVDLVFMEQVHGAGVAVVGLSDRSRGLDDHARAVPAVDALVTTDPDVGLVVLVADCVPVLLAVPRRGVAAVHAGRSGVAAGVVGAAVAALAAETGTAPSEVVALVGPAVGSCCYEVPAELQLEVVLSAPAARASTTWGTPSLDLPAAVVQQLRGANVSDIATAGACTRCEAGAWFSHRAATRDGASAGRQAGIVRMGAAPAPHSAGSCLDFG